MTGRAAAAFRILKGVAVVRLFRRCEAGEACGCEFTRHKVNTLESQATLQPAKPQASLDWTQMQRPSPIYIDRSDMTVILPPARRHPAAARSHRPPARRKATTPSLPREEPLVSPLLRRS